MSYEDNNEPLNWIPKYTDEEEIPSIITTGELHNENDYSFCKRKSYLTPKESVFIFSFTALTFLVCLGIILLLLLFVPFQ